MDFDDVLAARRMVRRYRPDPVPADAVERIAAMVRKAPSGGFSQGHRLIVVTDPVTRARIAELAQEPYYTRDGEPPWLSVAPVLMVLGICEDDYHARYTKPDKLVDGQEMEWPAPYWWVDSGALLMLIQLAAINEGLASGFATVPAKDELAALLGVPPEIAIVGVITIGYARADAVRPADTARLRSMRKPFGDLVRHESWKDGARPAGTP
ncbi:nitroreductase family protein [Actinomadura verrucosospora]|uniref:Nitroreductase-like protein n=1 Tax=Actinomadura verrucosospora TaxID=46165 RepID=A0A7D4AAV5_ACTVE|nr:nitroreductase family protein [Actinomadura verrucosospora]QKG26625.1 nitroreductase-like protein [Actinomadura verrucosospora]